MTTQLPTEHKDRSVVVDVIRGFALVGVLIANFTSYVDQQTPEEVLNSISSPIDSVLMSFNSVFIEWKFMTLFSILFGYGFGLILDSLQRRSIAPGPFFARRMFWLFTFGVIHSLFWWADVLHLYAISGVFLLLFKNSSNRSILFYAVLLALVVPSIISYLFRNQPETFTESDIQSLYHQYKTGSIVDVFTFNVNFYYRMFIVSGSDLHDCVETLGRFLFGYFLLRISLFYSVETKRRVFTRTAWITAPFMIVYFIVRWLLLQEAIHINNYILAPMLSLGILCTTSFYVSILILTYNLFGLNRFFAALQFLGRMTLTNYLLISAFLITLLYGIGFNQLGVLPMHIIWFYAFGWLVFEVIFSAYWLGHFRYGPTEWIWRQLSYRKRLPLRK